MPQVRFDETGAPQTSQGVDESAPSIVDFRHPDNHEISLVWPSWLSAVIAAGGDEAEAKDIFDKAWSDSEFRILVVRHLSGPEATDAKRLGLTPNIYRAKTMLSELHVRYENDRLRKEKEAAEKAKQEAAQQTPVLPPLPNPVTPNQTPISILPQSKPLNVALLALGGGLLIYLISEM